MGRFGRSVTIVCDAFALESPAVVNRFVAVMPFVAP
jgi:hypothetical protein